VAADGAAAEVAARLERIRRDIAVACRRAGREVSSVTLVGAAKRQPAERLCAARDAGLTAFGENRVEEAEAHREIVGDGVEWHLIGPLQSNKARRAAALFDVVHSLDRLKIARALDDRLAELDRRVPAFVEVNLGGEANKHGFPPQGLAETIRPLADLGQIEVIGLMAIPPPPEGPEGAEASRPWFRRLRELRDALGERPEWAGFRGALSMGMSADFAVAVEEGATHVRVGSLLFGDRPR
jgi:hypothetical protein